MVDVVATMVVNKLMATFISLWVRLLAVIGVLVFISFLLARPVEQVGCLSTTA